MYQRFCSHRRRAQESYRKAASIKKRITYQEQCIKRNMVEEEREMMNLNGNILRLPLLSFQEIDIDSLELYSLLH